jgi:hypothetical protein
MSLIQAGSNEIVVGQALPWPLYDQDRNLVLGEGEVVRDEVHREELLAAGVYHELSWGIGGNEDKPSAAENAPEHEAAGAAGRKFTFDDMKLKPEDRLQLEPPQQLARERFTVKVIGFLRGASMLVTMPITANGLRLQLMENEKVVMRSFTGQNAFGFATYIKKIIRLPYEYLHLTIPEIIEGITVRKAPRVKTRIIASVHDDKSGEAGKQSALISDISAGGLSLESKQLLGDKGDVLNLAFRVLLHNVEAYMSVRGIIRAVINSDAGDDAGSGMIRHGIELHELRPNDSVILQSMIYQQLIENPQKMV